MPLVKCPNCGKMISDRAEKCIFCGHIGNAANTQEDDALKAFLEEIEEKEKYRINNNGCLEWYNKNLKILRIPSSVRLIPEGDYPHEWSGYFIDGVPGFFENNLNIEEVHLPGSIREIGIKSFFGCKNLKKITFEEGLEKIRGHAFCNCEKLEEIILPGTLRYIDDCAFKNCKSLRKIVISGLIEETYEYYNFEFLKGKTEKILKKLSISNNTFDGCDSLESVIIKKGPLKMINWGNLLGGRYNLEHIEIPLGSEEEGYKIVPWKGGVKLIQYVALEGSLFSYIDISAETIIIASDIRRIKQGALGLPNAKTIVIGIHVEEIEGNPFGNLRGLKEIRVQEGNLKYCSVDGVLYGDNMQTLIWYPPEKKEKTFIIPPSVTTIGTEAFANTKYIDNLFIPDSVTKIANDAIKKDSFWHKIKNIRYPANYETF